MNILWIYLLKLFLIRISKSFQFSYYFENFKLSAVEFQSNFLYILRRIWYSTMHLHFFSKNNSFFFTDLQLFVAVIESELCHLYELSLFFVGILSFCLPFTLFSRFSTLHTDRLLGFSALSCGVKD